MVGASLLVMGFGLLLVGIFPSQKKCSHCTRSCFLPDGLEGLLGGDEVYVSMSLALTDRTEEFDPGSD